MREISIEGLKLIGAGANGRVYRLNEEQIVKVYNTLTNPFEKIEREKKAARTAFVHGIPTAISFDIVKVGNEYGMVYEMVNAKTLGATIAEHPEKLTEYIIRMADMLKQLHKTEISEGELPDGRISLHAWVDVAEKSGCYSFEILARMHKFIDEIPVRNTFVHGDFHPGNIMLSNDEMLLIDMGDASVGHPVIDLLGCYQIMRLVPEHPGGAMRYMQMPDEPAKKVCDIFAQEYFETNDKEKLAGIENLIRFYCLIRVFPGVTFSTIISDEERQANVNKAVNAFLQGVDKVKLVF